MWRVSCFAGLLLLASLAPTRADAAPEMHHQDHGSESPILAAYDFEEPTPAGPDTHWVRQRDGGAVALSDAFRFRGERSLHISEVPGNRDFAEFLAYFRECDEGAVYIQFYLMLTDPEQRFNFGLAGPSWFLSRKQDGHAVWLQTSDGVFRHHPLEGWAQLFAPRPFAWYFIDILYRPKVGTYELAIYEEGLEDPLVDVRDARSYNGNHDSSVKYFSLIGDLEDAGRFDFFVDDLLIATHPSVRQKPFVAPGRRQYFIESLRNGDPPDLDERAEADLLWQARRSLTELSAESPSEFLDALERSAEVAFWNDDLDLASEIYERLQEDPTRRVRVQLKLSDVKHVQGDLAGERALRERIYGRLGLETTR